ncbi:hypothetical protein MPSEU_000631200 [Mayamaea pseudoterrestris]|nr:hypothetical protein MPSEU_000631200 [Mayamaea pseudoterrestris]
MLLLFSLVFVTSVKAFQPSVNSSPSGSRLSYTNVVDEHSASMTVVSLPSPQRTAYHDNIFEAPSLYGINTLMKHSRRQGDIAIIRYHAPYCRACIKVAPKIERLARRNTDITFIEVPVSNKNPEKDAILEIMEVPSIPWGQVWHPQVGIVEELSLNPKYFDDFVRIVQSYQQGECELPNDIYQASGVYGAPYYRKERETVVELGSFR